MPSTYSSNLKLELMATGENSGTWGNITNLNFGTAAEQAIVGLGNVDYLSDANLTISITNSNSAQAARALVLNVTSSLSLTGTRELVVPTIEKQYIVQNNTTGAQSITVKTSAGTGITVPNGRKAHLYVDGTNVIQMFDFVDINGGAIDGTAIGGSSAAAGSFTTLGASGAATFNGAVTLGDAAADNITFNGTITSNLLFTDNTYDIGATGATRPRNLFLAGNATVGGNLSVGGTLTLTGGVNLNGNVTVGDSSADTLTVNATITSNLLFTDNTYDIGASGATRPRNLFLAGNITAGGDQTLTGALTVDSTTDSTSATTGSIQTDGGVGIAKALFVGTTVTVNGGTANGVTYLNASKVLTSGSALTFDGSAFGVTGSVAATAGITNTNTNSVSNSNLSSVSDVVRTDLLSYGSADTATLFGATRASFSVLLSQSGSGMMLGNFNNTPIIFGINNAEQMRLTSTGLGIGTSSPAYKLQLNSGSAVDTETGVTNSAGTSRFGTRGSGNSFAGSFTAGKSLELWAAGAQAATLDSSGNLGLGVTPSAWSPTYKAFQITSGAAIWGQAGLVSVTSNTFFDGAYKYIATGNATEYYQTSGSHVWRTAPSGTAGNAISFSQVMTLDASGNLGIGTSSPTVKLDVDNTTGATTGGIRVFATDQAYARINIQNTNGQAYHLVAGTPGASNSGFAIFDATAAATRVQIDSAGNLGLGVTPSASWGGGKAFVMSSGFMQAFSSTEFDIGSNAVFDGASHLYAANGLSALYRQNSGTHKFYTAPSGTAGNAISFSQAMTLDASGNLGIGETSPTFRISVKGATSVTSGINFKNTVQNQELQIGCSAANTDSFFNTPTNTAIYFGTNDIERARITSGGDFLVGTTDATQTAGPGVKIKTMASPNDGVVSCVGASSTDANETFHVFSTGASAYRFYVNYAGTVFATSTTISAISDRRLKENIRDLDDGLDVVMALKPRKFDWKEGKGENIKNARGFIAQEFETVLPDMIKTWKDPAPEGEEPYKAVNANLIPTLVKAIQEQQTLITALTARITALESSTLQ